MNIYGKKIIGMGAGTISNWMKTSRVNEMNSKELSSEFGTNVRFIMT